MSELAFTLPDLPGVRGFTEARALGAGLDPEAVTDLVIAVNEVATNAVTHGGVSARLRIWGEAGDLVIEIWDDGEWADGVTVETPPVNATSGMGLWVARLLADDLALRTGASGSTVVLRFCG
ncbi:ATP-binding protein [Nonomuraea sp. NBC_01738]|uniref:ATP-binding protein n=1 Tax=Nonomuraea sp. NBC_01738 TaxID=2976003 RepID=UPI002E0DBFC6|nr:ATP-binding protein [Nonomuraea sp. NBC_01738]